MIRAVIKLEALGFEPVEFYATHLDGTIIEEKTIEKVVKHMNSRLGSNVSPMYYQQKGVSFVETDPNKKTKPIDNEQQRIERVKSHKINKQTLT